MPALPVRELLVQLAGLRVDEIRGEPARVAPEERVRQRAVAPEEARKVQAHEQLGERVEQQVERRGEDRARQHEAVRQRVLEVPREQHRFLARAALAGDAHRFDHGDAHAAQRAEQPVLARGEARRQFLQRVQRAVVVDEANDVTVDSGGDVDEARRLPLRERPAPRQVEEVRMARAGDETKACRGHLLILRPDARSDRSGAPRHGRGRRTRARGRRQRGRRRRRRGLRLVGDGVAAHRRGRRRLHARPPRARPLDAAARLLRRGAERRRRPRDDERRRRPVRQRDDARSSSSARRRSPCPERRAGSRRRTAASGRCPGASSSTPAVELARLGVEVTPTQAYLHDILSAITGAACLRVGELIRFVDFAATLERIAAEGTSFLYDGDVARALCEMAPQISPDDLARLPRDHAPAR